MKLTALILLFFLSCGITFSQVIDSVLINENYNSMYQEKHKSLLTSVGMQRVVFFELGMAMHRFGRLGFEPISSAYYISGEFLLGKHPMVGFKIGTYAAGGVSAMALGADLIYYSNFRNSAAMLKPQVGFGIENFKLVYGYNIALTNPIDYLSRHSVTLTLLFSLKHLSTEYKAFE